MKINESWTKWLNDSRLGSAILLLAVIVTFWPSLSLPILDGWDDNVMIINELPRLSFNLDHALYWIYHRTDGYYLPTIMYTYMLDGILWKFNPAGMHLQNILWHIAAGLGFYACMTKLGCSRNFAFLGALLWLVQPLRVESVSWLTERKDVVFGALYFWSFRLYLSRERKMFYWFAVLAFGLAIGAKLMALSLPLIICLYEFSRKKNWTPWYYLRLNWPFWLIFIAGTCIGITEKRYFIEHHIPFWVKIGTALYNCGFYIGKTIWPFEPNPFYGKIIFSSGTLGVVSITIIAGITTGALLFHRRKNIFLYHVLPLLAGYLSIMAPVIGFFSLGSIDRADRYSYLPGAFIIFILIMILKQCHFQKNLAMTCAITVFLLYCGFNIWKTVTYQPIWNSVENIMTYAAECDHPNPVAVLATERLVLGKNDLPKAIIMVKKLQTSPYQESSSLPQSRLRLFHDYLHGRILYQTGQKKQAENVLANILETIKKDHWLGPNDTPIVLCALVDCYISQGKKLPAAECYRQLTILSAPQSFDFWFYSGLNAFFRGNQKDAIKNLHRALEITPQSPEAKSILQYIEGQNNLSESAQGPSNEKK